MTNLTAVYMAAGLSSRFGGRIKALIKVGNNNETLMGLSMNQAKQAGFNKFVIVVSDKTLEPLKEYYKDSFNQIPVEYCIQDTPDYREKPLGTAHATICAKNLVNEPFIVLNSDDIYGLDTLKKLADYLTANEKGYCLPGYLLKNCLPEQGTVNRGWIKVDKENFLTSIEEQFNISKTDIPSKYTGNELISMNIFGLQPDFFEFAEEDLRNFLEINKDDKTKEFLLPHVVTEFKNQTNKKIAVIQTNDIPLGVTNPEDEEKLRQILKNRVS